MRTSITRAAAVLALLLAIPAAYAEDIPRPSENVALGKPYTMEPAPHYEHCTDPGDAAQITDGAYTQGHFWTQPSTVGWQNAKPVVIAVDLGESRPIRGVSLNTAAGVAGVAWPVSIDVLVADEPGQYHAVGELVALDAPHGLPNPEEYATHRYWTDALRTHGRFVAFVIAAQPYFFVDEVEIYAGEPEWTAGALPGPAVSDLREQYKQSIIRNCIRRRLREDAVTLRERVAGKHDDLAATLDALLRDVETAAFETGADFRAVLPLNDLHERILAVQAARWRLDGRAALAAWQSGLWDALPFLADPETARPAAVEVHAMQNEYRAGAFNLSNASERPMTLELRFEGLPGSPAPDYVRVHEVAWTDTSEGVPVADALPDAGRQGEAWVVRIPPGVTRQVWLTFHPVSQEPGEYRGRILVTGDGVSAEVPVSLRIYPLRFPDRPTLHFGGWDYTDADAHYEMTARNRDALIALLREYWVDSPWATPATLPFGTHDASGAMTAPPDTARFDAWVARWPDARQYLVFPAVGDSVRGFKMATPEFDRAVGAWATFWAGHARAKGIDPQKIGLLLVDEPSEPEPQAIIAAWARAIRAADTGLRIWEDPVFKQPEQADAEMLSLCDSLCPNRPIFLGASDEYRKLYTDWRDRGVALEFYSCSGPVRRLDPYSYHRLQAWTCFRYGATASYFWAFGDAGGAPSWNEYATERAGYTPQFLDVDSVTTAKHLEACREGIEDYEYLVMLRKAAEAGDAAAKALVDEVPARVCNAGLLPSFNWSDPLDRTVADAARVEILGALAASGAK